MLPFWLTDRHKRREPAVYSGLDPQKGPESDFSGLFQQLFADFAEIADGTGRFIELGLLAGIHLDFDDPLDAVGADDHRNTDIEVLHAVLAGEIGGAGQNALLVEGEGLRHRDAGRGRRIEGRAGLQEIDDLAAAVAGAL